MSKIEAGFCQCGCGKETELLTENDASRGWVRGEYKRFIRFHHSGRFSGKPLWKTEDRGFKTPCWIWLRSVYVDSGYGQFTFGKNKVKAHRYFYEWMRGVVAPRFELDHLCRVRECINPDHLEPVLHVENIHRGAKAKLTMNSALVIRLLAQFGLNSRQIAKRFKLHTQTVYAVVIGRTWKEA